jgi:RNA polymerase sigma-70 factor (ECF subfamily)
MASRAETGTGGLPIRRRKIGECLGFKWLHWPGRFGEGRDAGRCDMNRNDDPITKAFLACRNGLVRSILRMSIRPADVDDILQETLLRVLKGNDKKRIQSPQGYLFVVSRNLVLEKLSQRSREISAEIDESQADVDAVPIDQQLHDAQKLERFSEALLTLSADKRRAILLRKFCGFSQNEIARKMGVSVSSVEKYIASGLRECRRHLITQGYEFEDSTEERPARGLQQTGEQGGDV